MFPFVRKLLTQFSTRSLEPKPISLRYFQTVTFLNSVSNSHDQQKQSRTVSYLMSSCGLSLGKAISAAKLIKIERTEGPDSVLDLLVSNGFTKSQIATLISVHPPFLFANSNKTLRPKIEYLKSLGVLEPDLPKIVLGKKEILLYSLKNRIMPLLDFLRTFVDTDENLVRVLKNSAKVISCNIQKVLVPNISTLRAHGVADCHIRKLILMHTRSLMWRIDLFKKVVDEVEKMGFEPDKQSFVLAVRVMTSISRTNWEKKRELLKSFGWSDEEFLSAFRVQPWLMVCSEKKIIEVNNFLVNKAGFKPSHIARCPNIFLGCLEKKIIPRFSVLQILMSKDFVGKNFNVIWPLVTTKKNFEQRFVTNYEKDIPEVIKAYWGETVVTERQAKSFVLNE